MMYKRALFKTLLQRLQAPRQFIQVLEGPRQVGKTTLAKQVVDALEIPWHYASADAPGLQDHQWLAQQWEIARLKSKSGAAVLVLDEIQKLADWSATIKQLWDEDTFSQSPLQVVLLGSAPLLIQHGLSESLAGRFEVLRLSHWSFAEMHAVFDWSLEQYLYFGGYPGAAPLIEDEQRWKSYIKDSLIETTLSRDILLLSRIHKPALLRQLFRLSCDYSGQIISYQKLLGQLDDAGNTTTLAHYLRLLKASGMVMGLEKISSKPVKTRASSPKLQVLNTALVTAQSSLSFLEFQADKNAWGRLVETAVGAYLVNQGALSDIQVYYWRERNWEVDFILKRDHRLLAIEVKSGQRKVVRSGMCAFHEKFKPYKQYLIGGNGIALVDFFKMNVEDLF